MSASGPNAVTAAPTSASAPSARPPGAVRSAAAVARREWMSLVLAPVGWTAMAAFALPPGVAFAMGALVPGAPVSMRLPLTIAAWSLFVVAPVLAWRSVGEERRAGTWDPLLASPAGAASIVMGKFLALVAFLVLLLLPLVAQWALLSIVARPDPGEFACGLLGVLLAGTMVLSSAFYCSLIAQGPAAAYLLAIGLWSAWILLGRALPLVVPPHWTAAAHGIDPLRRVDDFLLGMIDPAGLAFFAAIAAWFVLASIDAVADGVRNGPPATRRPARLALLAGVAVAAAALIAVASQPPLRATVDLTRTRAWTLSERTRGLVAELDGDWRIEAFAGPDSVDASALRQLDEVLARFDGLATANGRVRALRIDPDDPFQSGTYDEALERLERTFAAPLAEQRAAIDAGLASFERLAAWAGAEANALTALLAALPTRSESAAAGAESAAAARPAPGVLDDADRAALEQWRATCAKLAADHRPFVEARRAQARSSAQSPLGDAAGAAAQVETALRAWMEQCASMEQSLRELRRRERLPPEVIEYLRDAPKRSVDMAQLLATAQDRLSRLPELALAEVAAALKGGEAIVVSGPDRVAAIPGWQLLPPLGASPGGGAPVRAFDRRFRGEEVIASAVRSLRRGVAPEVVIVHAEGRSMLRPSPDRADASAIADALRSARCTVREWQPAAEPRPMPRPGRQTVWLVIPPLRRAGVEIEPRERRLLDAASRLVDSGEPVLLAIAPSLRPLVGHDDPWEALARRLGVEARSGATLLELTATSERTREVRAYFELDADPGHAASRGASGLATLVSEPVALRPGAGADAAVLLRVPPAANRWLEEDWRSAARRTVEVPETKRFQEPVPILMAVRGPGDRRAVVSGGAAWMLSGLADLTGSLGPERVFLRYPGNRELLVGTIGWLAGLDDGLASGSGREVERVPALEPAARWTMSLAASAGLPMVALAVALLVAVERRRA